MSRSARCLLRGHDWARTQVEQGVDDPVEVLSCRRCGHVDNTVLNEDGRVLGLIWQHTL